MILTPHFTLEELTRSQAATRLCLDNTPPPEALPNLVRTAQTLEQVRAMLGVSIIVDSGYRSPDVNRAVGGSATTAHCDGRAADFIAPNYGTPQVIAERIARSNLTFDQLIFEGAWVHIGIARFDERPRLQILTAHFAAGEKTTYTEGIA